MIARPRLLLTLGDVAGIGPEVILRAWGSPELHQVCRPIVVGDVAQLRRQLRWFNLPGEVVEVPSPVDAAPRLDQIPCLQATRQDLAPIRFGQVSAAAGRAAYDFLCRAVDLTRAGEAEGIVTAPFHKEGLRAAGLPYPGHTEILAERTSTPQFAMMLYAGRVGEGGQPLAVTHVTLHLALREVFAHLSPGAVVQKIELTDTMMSRLLGRPPRLGVCGLNPHASDGGLFGEEEANLIAPAVRTARQRGIDVSGPWPSDMLFVRAVRGEFDSLVAMYHDQGHIPFKLLAGYRAVNISAGLPIVRTSVAHGTAYDIAGQGVADPTSLLEACRVAAQLAQCSEAATKRKDPPWEGQ